jgi:hypothetical protein
VRFSLEKVLVAGGGVDAAAGGGVAAADPVPSLTGLGLEEQPPIVAANIASTMSDVGVRHRIPSNCLYMIERICEIP